MSNLYKVRVYGHLSDNVYNDLVYDDEYKYYAMVNLFGIDNVEKLYLEESI